jgi:hypothetical protein
VKKLPYLFSWLGVKGKLYEATTGKNAEFRKQLSPWIEIIANGIIFSLNRANGN